MHEEGKQTGSLLSLTEYVFVYVIQTIGKKKYALKEQVFCIAGNAGLFGVFLGGGFGGGVFSELVLPDPAN